ncbi:NUDIX hydrolase [Mycolicibacterium diernhoferi]|uniref:DNA mismatch repair protein MutT n=1 Tax=Mycolicibacterium diernhoferi TaxID=1801 RepID=A0A1Q4HLV0_9MYCO|nr:NUDIX domain-containing protein [Mycolicibacterium diernhoferi]OJZ68422.1 DNA mismatch repair protein MutT [Mycolicibacterium diernhoferi]OPE48685.1 DNA mismatch repair protein MutT [Mycolicibacterium diernhoferi]PEG52052.1 NUDIX domain-containing protein [Mycolicibacterium diernhoferi]QYL21080.1 NUDIX domain-containing protein [Mycolicibacterium diernhoferi]
MTPVIRIVAAVVLDDRNHVLVVRKRDTTAFMQPGGKFEAGESPLEALHREVREELGAAITSAHPLGHHDAAAANEPGHRVAADLFAVELDGPPRLGAEIVEMAWVDPHDPGDIELAPLTVGVVLEYARVS